MGLYQLPRPVQPLQCFKRPKIAKIAKEEEAKEQDKIVKVVEPAIKKRKLMKTTEHVNKRIMSPPKHLKSSQEILNLVGKIDKKKNIDMLPSRFGDFRINKRM